MPTARPRRHRVPVGDLRHHGQVADQALPESA
ncbi:hypothetical protein Ae406Ps2_0360c [Pseudonocardia sp. Ae406_Ps2]|nr:hypothetical protein Ae406Ps2_0360c [Pseudonocardia sp. Ae406_Ps2]OLM07849.1 hypothetical protein Ae331Ps2_5559 [Pseudonocardia sp. Ae331_Ps2]OLM13902.1 hypothetical protein Ae505Ps2_4031c [Pseudonocardia sp. Ae505_Ps2]OLM21929.1 hypothetical protein Ae706Ps2_0361c [Pseudonocardia sp. Ae706_Ps2]